MRHWRTILTIAILFSGVVYMYGTAQGNQVRYYHEVYTFKLNEIKDILASGADAQINVIPVDGNEIRVELSGALKDDQQPIIALQEGSQLKITRETKWFQLRSVSLGFFDEKNIIDIYINPEYHGNLQISSVSKPICIKSIQAKNLKVNNVSGGIDLYDVVCEKAKLSTISGHVDAQSLTAESSTVSTTSGRVDLAGSLGDLEGNSVSGRFSAVYTGFDNQINIRNVSGSITVQLADAADFALTTNTVSGKLTNAFGAARLGSGKNTIRLSTVSGRMTIQR